MIGPPPSTALLADTGLARVLSARIRPLVPSWRLSGPAYPVRERRGNNYWIHSGLAEAPAGSILVVGLTPKRSSVEAGHWGEILTHAARRRDLAGLVIDGEVRDGDALMALGWPIFATGTCPRGTTKRRTAGGGPGTVKLSGDAVAAGDWIVGDFDGAVVVPCNRIGDALAAADERLGWERETLDAVRNGTPTLAALRIAERAT